MNTTLQPPVPPQFAQRATSCDRHPNQPVTGFCASCLRERLAGLDQAGHRRSTGTAGKGPITKSVFFRQPNPANPSSSSAKANSSSLLPELRRCKSFSFSSHHVAPPPPSFEPQRRSCDVRGRNTLWSLFHLDDNHQQVPLDGHSSSNTYLGEIEVVEKQTLGFPNFPSTALVKEAEEPVVVVEEEEEEEEEEEFHEALETRVSSSSKVSSCDQIMVEVDEEEHNAKVVVGEEEEEEEEEEARPMKEHIDLDSQPSKKPPPKDLKEIAGSFWLAASVFSKKLQKWRRKQKLKKQGGGECSRTSKNVASSSGIGGREKMMRSTQSEFALDMFGRRSCDTDPRFSLDAGRISFDDPRFSWDEPRASWDGYLIGGGARSVFPRLPPILSVVEDVTPAVQRSDGLIPVEEDPLTPGGSAQTRDYYSDSQRRRRSLDRSSSIRISGSGADHDEAKPPVSNAKVSPAVGNEFFHHVDKLEREFRDSNSNMLRDDHCESFSSSYRDNVKGRGHLPKKSKRWSKAWNIWGFIHRRNNGRTGGNGVERSLSESWPELRRNAFNGRMSRSNSYVSSRHSFSGNSSTMGSVRRNDMEMNGVRSWKRREESVLDRHRSARYSPGNLDNGMLRFYLTPSRSCRHGNSSRQKSSHSFTRNVLRLY